MSLTLFTIIDFEPRLSDEALLIKEFKALHLPAYNKQEGDSQGRERKRAIQECSFIYHFCDYRSEYTEYEDDDRKEESLLAADLPENFEISEELQACIDVFIKLQDTRMLKALAVAELTLDKLRVYYEKIDFNAVDKNGALLYKPKDIMASVLDLGNTNKKLNELRRLVKAEMKETASLRGDHVGGHDGAT